MNFSSQMYSKYKFFKLPQKEYHRPQMSRDALTRTVLFIQLKQFNRSVKSFYILTTCQINQKTFFSYYFTYPQYFKKEKVPIRN